MAEVRRRSGGAPAKEYGGLGAWGGAGSREIGGGGRRLLIGEEKERIAAVKRRNGGDRRSLCVTSASENRGKKEGRRSGTCRR